MEYTKHIKKLEEVLEAFKVRNFIGGEFVCNELVLRDLQGSEVTKDLLKVIKKYLVSENTFPNFLYEYGTKKPVNSDGGEVFPTKGICRPYRIAMLNDLLEYYRGNCQQPLWNSILNLPAGVKPDVTKCKT
jgi:hypothetical protein